MPSSPVDTSVPGWRDVLIGGVILAALVALSALVSVAAFFLFWLLLEWAWAGLG